MKTAITLTIAALLLPSAANAVCNCEYFDLVAAQNIPVGYVEVCSTEDEIPQLAVTYVLTDPNWFLVETHLEVAYDVQDIPQTTRGKGGPIPGLFTYGNFYDPNCADPATFLTQSETFIISGFQEFYTLALAAHAVVGKCVETSDPDMPVAIFDETAWAGPLPFEGRNWATWFEYYFDICFYLPY